MEDINQFPFYKNYYELLDNLPVDDKRMMLEVIVDYMFKGIEPTNLEKMNLAIWNNIKMPLANIKKNIENGQKGGRPKKQECNTNKNPSENPTNNPKQKQNSISNFYLLISNNTFLNNKEELSNKIKDWLEYKWEKKEYYKEKGFKMLLGQIEKNTNQYGENKIIELIEESMANNYKGIIFDKLKNKTNNFNKKVAPIPDWVGKEFEKPEELTEEEKRFRDELIRGY